jgi:hypothetical protein
MASHDHKRGVMTVSVCTHAGNLVLEGLAADATGWDLKQKIRAEHKDDADIPPAAEQALVRPDVVCTTGPSRFEGRLGRTGQARPAV